MNDERKKIYYTILVDLWRLFIKPRKLQTFTDEWWEEVIKEYTTYTNRYKNTQFEDYCGELAISFLEESISLVNSTKALPGTILLMLLPFLLVNSPSYLQTESL